MDTVTAQSRRFGSHGKDEMRLALEVRYLEGFLERGGKYRFLRLETEKQQEPKLRNSRKGWNGEFTINLPDGKSHRWCAKEHPQMHGIVCVEVLGVTRTIRVEVPKTPAEADAPVCALPSTVRVHAIIRTRSQCPILREVSKNEEIGSLSWSDTTGGIKEIEETRSCGPIPREV
ncbi:unnamed protein product [Bathycoccus prasinos]